IEGMYFVGMENLPNFISRLLLPLLLKGNYGLCYSLCYSINNSSCQLLQKLRRLTFHRQNRGKALFCQALISIVNEPKIPHRICWCRYVPSQTIGCPKSVTF